MYDNDFTPNLVFWCTNAVFSLGPLMHEFARCSRWWFMQRPRQKTLRPLNHLSVTFLSGREKGDIHRLWASAFPLFPERGHPFTCSLFPSIGAARSSVRYLDFLGLFFFFVAFVPSCFCPTHPQPQSSFLPAMFITSFLWIDKFDLFAPRFWELN